MRIRPKSALIGVAIAGLVATVIWVATDPASIPMWTTSTSEGVSTEAQYAAPSPAADSYSAQTSDVRTISGSSDSNQSADASQMVVKSANMSLETPDVSRAVQDTQRLARSHGGTVASSFVAAPETGTSEPIGPDSRARATLTLRVPTARLDGLMDELSSLGRMLTSDTSAIDVSQQVIDVEARVRNLKAEERRLRELLERAGTISDLLEVETQLTRVQGEIESLTAQASYLKQQAAMSTLTVTIEQPVNVLATADDWGLRQAFARSIGLAMTVVRLFVVASVPVTLVAMIVIVLSWSTRVVRRRLKTTGRPAA